MVKLTVDDHLLAAYLFYGSILMLKTWAMSFFTARHRIKNQVCSELHKLPVMYKIFACRVILRGWNEFNSNLADKDFVILMLYRNPMVMDYKSIRRFNFSRIYFLSSPH